MPMADLYNAQVPALYEQLRRLAPGADLKRMIKGLRAEAEETRTEVDQLAYKLLELRAGIVSFTAGCYGCWKARTLAQELESEDHWI
jgi:hypothetical protein